MTKRLSELLEQMTREERIEVETFAAFVVMRRQLQQLTDDISSEEMLRLVGSSGSFDWLAQEEDIYSTEDGDEVQWPDGRSNEAA